jgi:hypothetical protein
MRPRLIELVEVDRIEVIAGLAFDEFAGDNTVPIREGRIRGAKLVSFCSGGCKRADSRIFSAVCRFISGSVLLGIAPAVVDLEEAGRPHSPGQGSS